MTTEVEATLEDAPEVVETEAEQVEASEATETTEGQVKDQPAKDDDAESEAEEISPSKARRERRKAEIERNRQEKAEIAGKLAEAEKRLARIEAATQRTQPPRESDFGSYEEYQANLAAYHSMKALDNRQRDEVLEEATGHKQALTAREQAREAELAANWQDQKAEASQKYADFDQVFSNDVPVTKEMAEVISSSDVGVDVAYYLGSNRQEAAQIAQMNPLEQARRLGAIEARMQLPRANTNPSAPSPIRPVKGKATATKSIDDMTMDEYMAARKAGKLK